MPSPINYRLIIDIVDALTDAIEENAAIPEHNVQKYERPAAVLPEDCPILVVWYLGKTFAPHTTNYFDERIAFGVSWQVSDVERAVTMQDQRERAMADLENIEQIEQALRDLSIQGWDIAPAYDMFPVSTDPEPPQTLETGLVRGYSILVQVMAQQRGNRT